MSVVNKTMEPTKISFNQDSPIYNIRILRIYIDYIEKNYPDVNIDKILNRFQCYQQSLSP